MLFIRVLFKKGTTGFRGMLCSVVLKFYQS